MKDSIKVIGQFDPRLELLDYLLDEDGIGADDQRIRRRNNLEEFPLSFAQKRLWLLDQLESGAHYNDHFDLRLRGPLQVPALQWSLNEIVRRHEVLRARFPMSEGKPLQSINPPASVPLACVDLGSFPDSERMAETTKFVVEAGRLPFDLQNGPVLRAGLLRLADQDHILILTVHHIAIDGWSRGVFLDELTTLYQAFIDGQPSPLPELPIQYADFAIWQQQRTGQDALVKQLDYWKQQLAGAPALQEWPLTFSRPEVQTFRGARLPVSLPKALTEALKNLSQREGCTLFMTLLAAFQTLAARYTRQEDIVVGSPIANRNRSELEGLIGCFLNTLVLRTDFSGNPTFRQVLARVREMALAAYAHQDVPYERLVEELHPVRNQSYNPLFQVMFVLQNTPVPVLHTRDLTIAAFEFDGGAAKFDLTFNLLETPEGISGWIEYATDLFDGAAITRMQGHYQTLLAGVVANPDQLVSTLPMLSVPERQQLLTAWNDTCTDYPSNRCVHELFEEQVARAPDAVALVFENEQWTYAELNARANQLAHHLRGCGVGPNILVGVSLERSHRMVMGILGVLKAGGAYLPVDPAYPQDRINFMLEDSKAPVLLTQQALAHRLGTTNAKVLCLDSDWELISRESRENPVAISQPEHLVYVIYTSGSTGRPKGVGVYHRGFTNLTHWFVTDFSITARDHIFLIGSLSFDLTQKGIYGPLIRGGCLYILPPGPYDPRLIGQLVEQYQITLINCTPSAFYPLVDPPTPQALRQVASLRCITIGGEPISLPRLKPWLESPTCHAEVANTYGPTECTDISASYRMNRESMERFKFVPIGKPIFNAQLAIVNASLALCPIAVPGELCIGGIGVGAGYLNDGALTAARFIENPFPEISSSRLYRTGDLARYLPDGNIEFLGRMDHQVKLRGFRIELHEIESALTEHPAIREAIVMAHQAGVEPTLVGYYVAKAGAIPDQCELREFLKGKLPEYMVPSSWVALEKFPLSPNGKVDRKALPAPEQGCSKPASNYIAPRSSMEKLIAEIWAKVLRLEKVGVHDSFFDIGGQSLLMVQVQFRLCEALGTDISIVKMFQYPTISALAKHLGQPLVESQVRQKAQDRVRLQKESFIRQQQSLIRK